MATQRRSTNQREIRTTQSQQEREKERTALIHIGGMWEKESKKKGQYYVGSVSQSKNPKTGKSGLDELKELVGSLTDGQSVSIFAFWNDIQEESQHAPQYILYASVYDPETVPTNGQSRGRGGRR